MVNNRGHEASHWPGEDDVEMESRRNADEELMGAGDNSRKLFIRVETFQSIFVNKLGICNRWPVAVFCFINDFLLKL